MTRLESGTLQYQPKIIETTDPKMAQLAARKDQITLAIQRQLEGKPLAIVLSAEEAKLVLALLAETRP